MFCFVSDRTAAASTLYIERKKHTVIIKGANLASDHTNSAAASHEPNKQAHKNTPNCCKSFVVAGRHCRRSVLTSNDKQVMLL